MGTQPGLKPIGTPKEEWQIYNGEYYDPRSGQKIFLSNGTPAIYTGPSETLPEGMSRSISKWTGTRNFGPGYKESELKAGQEAEDFREGAGFLDQKPSQKPVKPDPEPDTDEDKPQTPAPVVVDDVEDVEEQGDVRTNKNGIVQKGMTLGGIKNYLQGTGLGLADASQYFQMGEPTYGSKVTGPNNEVLKPETDVWSEKAGGLVPPSAAGVTGKSPQDPQAGVSDVPDQADNSRALSLSGGEEPFGGSYGDDDEYVSPMYADKARNKWRSTWLNSRAKGPAALMREADASIGIIRDNKGNIAYKNGDSYSTYSGDGDTRDVIYDIRGGQSGFGKHQSDFTELGALEVPDTPTIKPDDEQTEATIEGAATIPWKDMNKGQKEDTVSAFAQDFANWYKQGVKDQNK